MTEIEEIKRQVKKELSEGRFNHTMGVANEAEKLAKRWGVDPQKAYIAGLVHDFAKETHIAKVSDMLKKFGCFIDEETKSFPAILHGPLAAYIAREKFKIEDEDIFNAIWYHTTGRQGMSQLEKIIYLADFIEPNRKFEGVNMVRKLAYEDLDRAVLCEADMVIVFTIERGRALHSKTVEARNDMLNKTKEVKTYEG